MIDNNQVRVSFSIHVSQDVADTITRLARERGVQRSGLALQALALFQAAHDAGKNGKFVGIATDMASLEVALLMPLVG